MKGLRIDTPFSRNFTRVFASVMDEFQGHYWLIDTQSGPFNITDKPNFEELEAETAQYCVPVRELEDSSTGLWRPGILQFANILVIDEWTYLFGILGSEDEARKSAVEISALRKFTPEFFEFIEQRVDLALIHVDGWWEAYSTNAPLMEKLRQIEGASETDPDVQSLL
jgi:hypothetical protein